MNFWRRFSNRHGRPRRMLIWTFDRSVIPSNVHINILRGLPCRLESLRQKFTNEPSIFADGDLDESIKRSASDRLDDLVPQVRARTSPGFFHDMALLGLCLELLSSYFSLEFVEAVYQVSARLTKLLRMKMLGAKAFWVVFHFSFSWKTFFKKKNQFYGWRSKGRTKLENLKSRK